LASSIAIPWDLLLEENKLWLRIVGNPRDNTLRRNADFTVTSVQMRSELSRRVTRTTTTTPTTTTIIIIIIIGVKSRRRWEGRLHAWGAEK
jgi:hypothetical protein